MLIPQHDIHDMPISDVMPPWRLFLLPREGHFAAPHSLSLCFAASPLCSLLPDYYALDKLQDAAVKSHMMMILAISRILSAQNARRTSRRRTPRRVLAYRYTRASLDARGA